MSPVIFIVFEKTWEIQFEKKFKNFGMLSGFAKAKLLLLIINKHDIVININTKIIIFMLFFVFKI